MFEQERCVFGYKRYILKQETIAGIRRISGQERRKRHIKEDVACSGHLVWTRVGMTLILVGADHVYRSNGWSLFIY